MPGHETKQVNLTDIFTAWLKIYSVLGMASEKENPTLEANLAQDLRALISKLKRRLREQADAGDLPPSKVSVLLRLEKDGPATASSLARAEGMRPQSIAPIIAGLESAGLISGAPDRTDGRRILLSLSESCRIWLAEGRAARQDWLTHALQTRLTSKEQGVVSAAVELLGRLVD